MRGPRPLAAPASAFSLGIALGAWLPAVPQPWSIAAAAAFATAAALFALKKKTVPVLWTAFFLALGLIRFQAAHSAATAAHIVAPSRDATARGVVSRPPEVRDGVTLIELERPRLERGGAVRDLPGELQVYLEGEEKRPRVGEVLMARGSLSPPRRERNFSWFATPQVSSARSFQARLFVSSPVWTRSAAAPAGEGFRFSVRRLRQKAVDFWDRRGGARSALLKALTTGQRGSIPDEVRENFRRTGLAHLLAVSGLHLGFAALFLYCFLRWTLAWIEPLVARYAVQPIAAVATMPALVFVYLFSGEQISAGRASAMACLGLGVTVLCRKADLLNLVACAALAMLAVDPFLLFRAAFQLSFAAVLCLVIAAPRLAVRPPGEEAPRPAVRLLSWFRGVILASLVASAGTLPLVAYHFQRIPLAGPALNVAAVPLTGFVILPLGWGSLLTSTVWPAAGNFLADLASLACGLLMGIAGAASRFSWISVPVPRPSPLLTVTLFLLVVLLLGLRGGRGGWARPLAAAAGSLFLALGWWGSLHRAELRGVFLDVGQGEAALMLLPGGESFLVDTGPSWRRGDAGRYIVVPALRKMGVTSLDHVVVSHFHPDHSGGLPSILKEIKVREIWTAPFEEEDLPGRVRKDLRRWEEEGGRLRFLTAGDSWEGDEGVRIDVLGPSREPAVGRSLNERSLVLLLRWRKAALLLTGDAGGEALQEAAGRLPDAGRDTLLKVPHHGGLQDGTDDLVRAFGPKFAVISVGRNSYGHPSPATIESCRRWATVLRTDREGAVFFRSGGEDLALRTWREKAEERKWRDRVRWLLEGR